MFQIILLTLCIFFNTRWTVLSTKSLSRSSQSCLLMNPYPNWTFVHPFLIAVICVMHLTLECMSFEYSVIHRWNNLQYETVGFSHFIMKISIYILIMTDSKRKYSISWSTYYINMFQLCTLNRVLIVDSHLIW